MTPEKGWVDLYTEPHKNSNGTQIALTLPQDQGNGDKFKHVCLLSTTVSSNARATPEIITKGKFTVQSILHWDSIHNIIFYTANTEEHSEVLHVYAIRAAVNQSPQCLTCKLHHSGDVEQSYYTANFNTDKQVIITSQGPGIPMTIIYEWNYADSMH